MSIPAKSMSVSVTPSWDLVTYSQTQTQINEVGESGSDRTVFYKCCTMLDWLTKARDLHAKSVLDGPFQMKRDKNIHFADQVVPFFHADSLTLFWITCKKSNRNGVEKMKYTLTEVAFFEDQNNTVHPGYLTAVRIFAPPSPLSAWTTATHEALTAPPLVKAMTRGLLASSIYQVAKPTQWPSRDEMEKWAEETKLEVKICRIQDRFLNAWEEAHDIRATMQAWQVMFRSLYDDLQDMLLPRELEELRAKIPALLYSAKKAPRFNQVADGALDMFVRGCFENSVWKEELREVTPFDIEAGAHVLNDKREEMKISLRSCICPCTGEILLDKVSEMKETVCVMQRNLKALHMELTGVLKCDADSLPGMLNAWVTGLTHEVDVPLYTMVGYLARLMANPKAFQLSEADVILLKQAVLRRSTLFQMQIDEKNHEQLGSPSMPLVPCTFEQIQKLAEGEEDPDDESSEEEDESSEEEENESSEEEESESSEEEDESSEEEDESSEEENPPSSRKRGRDELGVVEDQV